jgi:hypothetical protein
LQIWDLGLHIVVVARASAAFGCLGTLMLQQRQEEIGRDMIKRFAFRTCVTSAIVIFHRDNIYHVLLQQHHIALLIICQSRITLSNRDRLHITPPTSLSQIHPSRSNISLRSSLASLSGSISAIILHISRAIFSLFLHTMPLFFHSFSIFSRSLAVTCFSLVSMHLTYVPAHESDGNRLTFFAFPFFSPSSLARIAASSVSSACTSAMRSAVLSVELRDERVLRSVFAVARSVVVCVRRSRILVSSSASCSVVHASAAFWGRGLDCVVREWRDGGEPGERGIRSACLGRVSYVGGSRKDACLPAARPSICFCSWRSLRIFAVAATSLSVIGFNGMRGRTHPSSPCCAGWRRHRLRSMGDSACLQAVSMYSAEELRNVR